MGEIIAWLVKSVYISVGRVLDGTSFTIEAVLSHLHNLTMTARSCLDLKQGYHVSGRAWWDPRKGSAVVIWSAGDQSLSHGLALSLAALTASQSTPLRTGEPPYTVIVLLPSASHGLAQLISNWAKQKAAITQRATTEREPDSASPKKSSYSPSISSEKRRRLSLGGWSAGDVVGYGMDMLKGLNIGQTRSETIGAIIPVVADTSTFSGLEYAQSTIQDYCSSHELLLRGLIVIPSIMTIPGLIQPPRKESYQGTSMDQMPQQSSHDPNFFSSSLFDISEESRKALGHDICETINVVTQLLSILQQDKGRLIGLLPTGWHTTASEVRHGKFSQQYGSLSFAVTREAVYEMWQHIRDILQIRNVSVSLIQMAPVQKNKSPFSMNQSQWGHSPSSNINILLEKMSDVAHSLLFPSSFLPGPRQTQVQPNEEYVSSLLVEAVRNLLAKRYPRKNYTIGLGPYLENVWACIPGHRLLGRWITARF